MRSKVWRRLLAVTVTAALALSATGCGSKASGSTKKDGKITLTNVSYDPTRELYAAYNKEFAKYYKGKTG
nr:sulfate ABC transporter substrate-binding protein [Lachnospiraceae bacterium]